MLSVDIDLIGIPAFVIDVGPEDDLRFAAVNAAQTAVTGLDGAQLVGRPLHDCMPRALAAHFRARYLECVRKRSLHQYDEMLDIPGAERWWRTTLTPVLDETTGRVTRIVGVAVEITERKLAEEELADAVLRDALTGIGNRRRLEIDAGTLIERSPGPRNGFGLVVIDLDGFKAVNDTFGHSRGDQVLRHVASLLSLAARPNETVARVGGDEFAMLVSASSETELAATVTSLRRFLDRSMMVTEIEVDLGASVGAALWTCGQTFGNLLDVADMAMYAQKALRRKRAA